MIYKCLNCFFFLPSITDRSEQINQYLKNVSTTPFDVEKTWCGGDFNPNKLDIKGIDSDMMRKGVIEALKHIASVSNSNLIRNADG